MRKKYTTLLFDADGTLFDYKKTERNALVKSFNHFSIKLSEDDFISKYRLINNQLWQDFESGKISLPELRTVRFTRLFESLSLPIDPFAFGKIYILYLGEGDEMLPDTSAVLEKINGKYTMALITNGIAEVQHRRIKSSGLDKYFPYIFISEEIGSPKPETRFFDITMRKLSNPSREETLIIGDSLTSDIAGGNLSGIDTCWFNPQNKENDTEYSPTYTIAKLTDLLDLV